jgi:hypothetical protein
MIELNAGETMLVSNAPMNTPKIRVNSISPFFDTDISSSTSEQRS